MFYISTKIEGTQMQEKHYVDTDSKNVCNDGNAQIIEDITDKIAPKKTRKKKSE